LGKVLVDSPSVYVFREEPLDAVEDLFGPSYFVALRNFELNRSTLKPPHKAALEGLVAGYVKRNVGFAEIYAMTDRSGTRDVNYKVSATRLTAVQEQLIQLGAPHRKVYHAFAKAIGEDLFEERAKLSPSPVYQDGGKHPGLRRVVIALTPAPMGVPSRFFRHPEVVEVVSFCRQHEQKPGK
jgi:hypothetical protein